MAKFLSLLIIAAFGTAQACSFCGGGLASRGTLREQSLKADAIVLGTLKNAKLGEDIRTGTTEFHFDEIAKGGPGLKAGQMLLIPRYIPAMAEQQLFFLSNANGKPDVFASVPGSPAVAAYVVATSKLNGQLVAARLGFFFKHLDSPDATIAADAFTEFAKATDAEVLEAKGELKPAALRKFLTDPKTPADRLGVYAMLLGLCDDRESAPILAKALDGPLSERVSGNLGGYLAGYTLLDAKAGWKCANAIISDAARPFEQRLSAIGAVRYFQANRTADSKAEVLACYRGLLDNPDFADVALDDLRRWAWWDLTADVLKQYGKPTHAAPILRNGIIRYALTCPDTESRKFVAALRQTDPKLLAKIEESLKLLELPKK